jgi:hypothetical protein
MKGFNAEAQAAMDRGIRNQRVVSLAANHCSHMEFVGGSMLGVGMLEVETGLPIGMRFVQCKFVDAGQYSASVDYENLAADFYKTHCVGCAFRNPNGQLPTLGLLVEARDRAAAETAEAQLAADRLLHSRWAARAEKRRLMRLTGIASTITLSNDLDDLDPEPGKDHPDANAARLRVEAAAARAPELFSSDVIAVLFGMVEDAPNARTLEPLRLLSRKADNLRAPVLNAALARLSIYPDADAGRCLVEFAESVDSTKITALVMRSTILLAGAPVYGDMGFLEENAAAEVEPFRVLAARTPELAVDTLSEMLPGASPKSTLELPGYDRNTDNEFDETRDRTAAAAAIRSLLSSNSELAIRTLPFLLRNLELEDDRFDGHASSTVTDSAARLVVSDLTLIDAVIKAGEHADSDYREALVGVFGKMLRIFEPDSTRGPKADSSWQVQDVLAAVFPRLLGLVGGEWGARSATNAGELLEYISSRHTSWAGSQIEALFGALIAAHERASAPQPPSPLVLANTDPTAAFIASIEASSDRMLSNSVVRRVREAIAQASGGRPIAAATALKAALSAERESPLSRSLVWDILDILGDVGADNGMEPGLLNAILPTLRGYLVHADAVFRAAAIEAWGKIAQRHPVPNTLHDLLPALLGDLSLGVIRSMLQVASRLEWSAEDRDLLLRWAMGLSESKETLLDNERPRILGVLLSLSRWDPGLHEVMMLLVLTKSLDLDDGAFHDFVNHRRWSGAAARSTQLGVVRWRQYTVDAQLGLRDDDHERPRDLLALGPGLLAVPFVELRARAVEQARDHYWGSLSLVEVVWRAYGWAAAGPIYADLLSEVPDEPREARRRALLQLLIDWDTSNGQPIPIPTDPMVMLEDEDRKAHPLFRAYELRLRLREALERCGWRPGRDAPSTADVEELRAVADQLRLEASRDTDTASYLRAVADLLYIAMHLSAARIATLNAKTADAQAHETAASERAREVDASIADRWAASDPLRLSIQQTLDAIKAHLREPQTVIDLLLALPTPPLFIRESKLTHRGTGAPPREPIEDDEPAPRVAVAILSVDGKTITGPQVLRPNQVYRLGVTIRLEEWPSWATALEAEFITDLTDSEIALPKFRWTTPSTFAIGSNDELTQDGTLICHFAKGRGVPAPRFRLYLRWFGQVDGHDVSQPVDVAAHREIQLRPFDATTDSLTENGPFDERLLQVFDRLRAANTDEAQVQAFARLLSAIARASLRIAWSKPYKLGAHISERKFHDDLYEMLLADPELEGRVERGKPSGLGYNDLRHDGITAELKVEKTVPETRERSAKYISQTSQYATSDGARVSILCVLDMTRKEAVVAPPENYLWVLEPPVHALPNPLFPPAVAVHVINAWSPSPSSWSRRRAPVIVG